MTTFRPGLHMATELSTTSPVSGPTPPSPPLSEAGGKDAPIAPVAAAAEPTTAQVTMAGNKGDIKDAPLLSGREELVPETTPREQSREPADDSIIPPRPSDSVETSQPPATTTKTTVGKSQQTPPRPLPLGRTQDDESPYLEPPTPTQPLLELSPTPISFPSNIHTSSPLGRIEEPPHGPTTTSEAPDPPASAAVTSPPYWSHGRQQHQQRLLGDLLGDQPLPLTSRTAVGDRPARPPSLASTDSLTFGGITLCDNEVDARNAACWAKSVTIRDYTIVNGSSSIPSAIRPALARVGSSRPSSRSGGGVVHTGSQNAAATSPRASEDGGEDFAAEASGGWNMRATLGMGGIGAFVVFNVCIETLDGGAIEIKRRYSEFDSLRDKLVGLHPRWETAMPALPPKSVVSRFRPGFLEKRRRGLEYFLSCVLLNPQFAGSPATKEFIFA